MLYQRSQFRCNFAAAVILKKEGGKARTESTNQAIYAIAQELRNLNTDRAQPVVSFLPVALIA